MSRLIVVSLALCLLASAATALPVTFFGIDLSPGFVVPAGGNAETARNAFLSNLTGVGSEDFESFNDGDVPPLAISFPGSTGNLTASLTGAGIEIETGTGNSLFATSGTKYVDAGFGNTFTIDFGATPVSAFGFYGTDISDSGGDLELILTDTDGNVSTETVITNAGGVNNGSVLFYGFIDPAVSYQTIALRNTSGGDQFGFDDMVIGDREQINPVPEPGTMALLGIGLLGLGTVVVRRRRDRS